MADVVQSDETPSTACVVLPRVHEGQLVGDGGPCPYPGGGAAAAAALLAMATESRATQTEEEVVVLPSAAIASDRDAAEQQGEVKRMPSFESAGDSPRATISGMSTFALPRDNKALAGTDGPLFKWTIAMVFPSAADKTRAPQSYITPSQAEQVFDACFRAPPARRSQKLHLRDKEVFMDGFYLLPDPAIEGRRRNSFPRLYSSKTFSNLRGLSFAASALAGRPPGSKRYCLEEDEDPKDLAGEPRCFLELLQKAVIRRLMKFGGLAVEVHPGKDHVLMLLSCDRRSFLKEAQRQGYPAELDLQCTDPASMEPCTRTFVPLLTYYFSLGHNGHRFDELQNAYDRVLERIATQWTKEPLAFRQRFSRAREFWITGCTLKAPTMSPSPKGGLPSLAGGSSCAEQAGSVHSSGSAASADDGKLHVGGNRAHARLAAAFLSYLNLRAERGLGPSSLSLIFEAEEGGEHTSVWSRVRAWSDVLQSQQRVLWNVWDWLSGGSHPRRTGNFCRVGAGAGLNAEYFRSFYVNAKTPEPSVIDVPFSSQDRIHLLRSIVERDINVGMLLELELADAFFPLDSEDKEQRLFVPGGRPLGDGDPCEHFQETSRIPDLEVLEAPLARAWKLPEKVALHSCMCKVVLYGFKKLFVPPPLEDVAEYYGPRVGFYFAMAQHFAFCLALPGLVGLVVTVVRVTRFALGWEFRTVLDNLFAALVPVWCSVALEFWKRKEAWLASQWGQICNSMAEPPRPAFWGLHRSSPIDGAHDLFFPFVYQQRVVGTLPRQMVSYSVLLSIAVVELGCIFAIGQLRSWLVRDAKFAFASIVTGIVLSLVMTVFGMIGRSVAHRLNQWENHRTSSDFVGQLALKVFIFEFINRYFLFYYMAFWKAFVEGCIVRESAWDDPQVKQPCDFERRDECDMCKEELMEQVPPVFFVSILMNFVELVWPLFRELRRLRLYRKETEGKTSCVRDDVLWSHRQQTYGSYEVDGSFEDYLEIMILFGYNALFALAFPAAPMIAALVLLIELRVDGLKLFNVVQRPFPERARSVQTWKQLFLVLSAISVVTNAALSAFTFDFLGGTTSLQRWLRFLAFVLGILFLCTAAQVAIPDSSEGFRMAQARDAACLDRIGGHDISARRRRETTPAAASKLVDGPLASATSSTSPLGMPTTSASFRLRSQRPSALSEDISV